MPVTSAISISGIAPHAESHSQPNSSGAPKPVIALVCNDSASQSSLRLSLDQLGYASVVYEGSDELANAWKGGSRPDLILLAPSDTKHVCHLLVELRSTLPLPVIVVVPVEAQGCAADMRQLLQGQGRVDFIVAPATSWEIECRAQALLQRTPWAAGSLDDPRHRAEDWTFGQYRFLVRQQAVLLDGCETRLRPREFELAQLLFRHLEKLVARDWLWSRLWGRQPAGNSRSLDVCAAGVRKKLNLQEENGFILAAVYGKGYRLSQISPADFPAPEMQVASPRYPSFRHTTLRAPAVGA